MINVGERDLELPQIGKEPKVGYQEEFIEYTMLSGLVRRIYKGRRFKAIFTYAYLLDDERDMIFGLLDTQRINGALPCKITTPDNQEWQGDVTMEINSDQSRFAYSNVLKDYVWTNWTITLSGTRLEK